MALRLFQASALCHKFYEEMKLFDPNDRTEIEYGLKRVFDYNVDKINSAIAAQAQVS